MMKIKILAALLISLVTLFVTGNHSMAVAAPRLYLDPATITANNGTEFTLNLKIDVEAKSAFGAEALITYQTADIELKSITNGGFFTDFATPSTGAGKINIRGYFSQTFESKSGSGAFAILKFTSKKDSGSGTVSFVCSGSGSDTFILDSNGNNILTCSTLNQTNLTYSSNQDNNNNDNNNSSGTPNTCGGTCGSNVNCQSGYFCYTSFCRNPACPNSSNCLCPTIKPTVKPKPRVIAIATSTPTPQVVSLTQYDLSTFVVPTSTPEAVTSENQNKSPLLNYLLIAGAFILGGGILFIIIKALKGSSSGGNPPFTQVPPVQTPPII